MVSGHLHFPIRCNTVSMRILAQNLYTINKRILCVRTFREEEDPHPCLTNEIGSPLARNNLKHTKQRVKTSSILRLTRRMNLENQKWPEDSDEETISEIFSLHSLKRRITPQNKSARHNEGENKRSLLASLHKISILPSTKITQCPNRKFHDLMWKGRNDSNGRINNALHRRFFLSVQSAP